jgi:hypothetical protein
MDRQHGHTLALFSLAYIIHLLKMGTAADPYLLISDTASYTNARETDTEQQVRQICN